MNFCVLTKEDDQFCLCMGCYDEEEWIELSVSDREGNLNFSSLGGEVFDSFRKRFIEGSVPKLLSVSEGRGVGSLFCPPSRMIIFDLEDDEYPDDEEEEEEEQEC